MYAGGDEEVTRKDYIPVIRAKISTTGAMEKSTEVTVFQSSFGSYPALKTFGVLRPSSVPSVLVHLSGYADAASPTFRRANRVIPTFAPSALFDAANTSATDIFGSRIDG